MGQGALSPLGRGTGTGVGIGKGASDGAAKPSGAEPVPIGNDGEVPEGSCLATLMGDAVVMAARPARRIVTACIFVLFQLG